MRTCPPSDDPAAVTLLPELFDAIRPDRPADHCQQVVRQLTGQHAPPVIDAALRLLALGAVQVTAPLPVVTAAAVLDGAIDQGDAYQVAAETAARVLLATRDSADPQVRWLIALALAPHELLLASNRLLVVAWSIFGDTALDSLAVYCGATCEGERR